jgi:hypothetical protein
MKKCKQLRQAHIKKMGGATSHEKQMEEGSGSKKRIELQAARLSTELAELR